MTLRRIHDDEQGIALITVIGLSMVLALLVAALLQYGVGSMQQARQDQDWHASLAAADAGVDEFLARINRDVAYWQHADDDCDECSPTLDPNNPALTGFTSIPGGEGEFRYDVDASGIGSAGVIVVTATGRVNDVDRTVRAELRKRTFLDYLYFTEYETLDPTAYTTSADRTWAAANCSRYRYATPSRPTSGRPSSPGAGCIDITWFSIDTITGPFHSNDQLAINGSPTWEGPVSTSQPDGTYLDTAANRLCRARGNPSGCTSNPSFQQGLQYGEALTLPPSNNQIKAEATSGCIYVGATWLQFNANGSVRVKSARTDSPSASRCPTDGTMTSLPPNGVIYVRAAKPNESCLSGNPHPYSLSADITDYDRCAGDAFVEGTLNGRATVAAENNIVIANDIRYAGGRGADTDDMLGLVANNFVEIMHPVNHGREDLNYLPGGKRFEDPHIDAAILSVEHSFRVQNHNDGKPFHSPIDLFGTISQLYRGPVGSFNSATGAQASGYPKAYKYDPRLAFISPPHYLDPVKSAWSVRSWSEE